MGVLFVCFYLFGFVCLFVGWFGFFFFLKERRVHFNGEPSLIEVLDKLSEINGGKKTRDNLCC